tara:strand:+ start:2259 stop:2471 length:213 start_codon:yes stop_codon:yes gene_type:complete
MLKITEEYDETQDQSIKREYKKDVRKDIIGLRELNKLRKLREKKNLDMEKRREVYKMMYARPKEQENPQL